MPKEIRYCSIDDCSRQLFSKGWCQSHYNRNYKYGDPLSGPEPKKLPVPCLVDGCLRNEKIRQGYCSVHYERFLKDGDPGPPIGVYNTAKAESRFWEQVDMSGGDIACWPWTGRKRGRGKAKKIFYGEFTYEGRTKSTHRLSYEFTYGVKLTPAEPVHHKCANTLCQNPKHLQVTTPQENTAEMLERNYYLARIAELETKLENCKCHVQSDN